MDGELEAIRRRYTPEDEFHLFLLGESPPQGRGFFYTGNSTLFGATAPIFVRMCSFSREPAEWLDDFMQAGCYLDDFSSIRGDKPHLRASDADVRAAVHRLAAIITTRRPTVVVAVLREIQALAEEVIAASSAQQTPLRVLRFPYFRSAAAKAEYGRGLSDILREFGCSHSQATRSTGNV
jgi:hypothetical protein